MSNYLYNNTGYAAGNDHLFNPELRSMLDEVAKHISIANMNEFVVSSSNKSLIGTVGLATCDGIFLYDRDNKWGMVGHAAGELSKKLLLLEEMINQLPKDRQVNLEYQIVTGFDNVRNGNYNDTVQMTTFLENNLPDNITLTPLNTGLKVRTGEGYGNEFLFDVKSGTSVSDILKYYNYLFTAIPSDEKKPVVR